MYKMKPAKIYSTDYYDFPLLDTDVCTVCVEKNTATIHILYQAPITKRKVPDIRLETKNGKLSALSVTLYYKQAKELITLMNGKFLFEDNNAIFLLDDAGKRKLVEGAHWEYFSL